ncbi:MAG: S41 family peptidase [Candidatus Limnocylindrales bacterium]
MTDQLPADPADQPGTTLSADPGHASGPPDEASAPSVEASPGPSPEASPELATDARPPLWPVVPRRRPGRSRAVLVAALALVVVVAGSGILGAGFLLGRQSALTPGTPADRQELFQPFWDAYDSIAKEYVGTVDQKALVEGAIKGMFGALGDPFSQYLSSEDLKNTLTGISGQFEGIGAVMTTRDDKGVEGCTPAGPTCHVVVVRTIPGAPAAKAGLLAGDEVVAIDGSPLAGKTLDQTVALVRGPKDTTVRLSIVRGSGAPFEMAIVRAVIDNPVVSSDVIAGGKVGYIRLDSFSSGSADEFQTQLKALVDQGLTRIVFDLRGDPGGFIDAAQKIGGQFIASGPVFWEEFADGTQVAHDAAPGGVATDPQIQVVVLIDKGTASASEIVAGALQDTGRARLVGQTSYGKGTVQQFQQLGNDTGGFRLSVAKWLTPKKTWINGKGLTPDVAVTVPAGATTDVVLQKAIELLTGASS